MAGGALIGLGGMSALWMLSPSTSSTRSATCAGARCPTRCRCRSGSRRRAARRWASRTSALASAARRAVALLLDGPVVGLARRAAGPWSPHHCPGVADGLVREGGAGGGRRGRRRREGRERRRGPASRGVPQAGVLPARLRQHVLDCCGRRRQPAPEAVHEPRRGLSQGDAARIISLVLGFSIAGRLLMGWLADRIPKKT